MSWIKQNKFLSGFIAVMVVGAGALGYLLFKEQSRYAEVRADYETKASELNRLETLKPYPDTENLKKIEAQKAQHVAAIEVLDKNVAAAQIPVEPLTREAFQDELRKAVTRITNKAKDSGLALPAMFYLGMEKYQTEPPLPEAAPVLGRQLKALEFVITKMIEDKIVGISKFERDALPEEEGKARKDAPAKPGASPAKSEKSAKHLVAYRGVQMEFTAEQSRFRNFLDEIVAEKSQFYVPRLVIVKNEKDAAPPRDQPGVKEGPNKGEDTSTKVVFGSEKLNITLVLDIVDFAEVAAK